MAKRAIIGLVVLLMAVSSGRAQASHSVVPWSPAQCAIAAAGHDPDRPRIGTITIGRLGKKLPVFEGHSRKAMANGTDPSLDCGPTWIPGTGQPCWGLPVDMAGHHVTHMRPFLHLDLVRKGDYITVAVKGCQATYQVSWTGVPHSDWPYDNKGQEKLVLSTCLFPYVEGERHFVVALLVKSKPVKEP